MLERFDRYVERCLYDPVDGFYASGAGVAGRRGGDFVTSPEVGPLFADVLAAAIDGWWAMLGEPPSLPVLDVGTGPGTLARALAAAPGPSRDARVVVGVDRDPAGADPLPEDLSGAIVIANELLDNLPFRIVQRAEAGWDEVWVETDDHGVVTERLVPLEPPTGETDATGQTGGTAAVDRPALLDRLDLGAVPVGARVPVLDAAAAWVTDVLDRGPAVLLVLDYGSASTVELARRGGWLRTYRNHQRGDDPYLEPGRWDITTDVAIDQLPPPTQVVDQAEFLRRWGIDALVDEGRARWAASAAAPDLEAIRMRSRATEAAALLDPSGLGSWLVCTWSQLSVA